MGTFRLLQSICLALYLLKVGSVLNCYTLSVKKTNQGTGVRRSLMSEQEAQCNSQHYSDYTPENRKRTGRYNTEHGTARPTRHFAVSKSHKQQ